MAGRRRAWISFVIPAIVICLLSMIVLFSRIDVTQFHGDEAGWIWSAYYYTNIVSKGDYSEESWECKQCGPWGELNMHVGKLLIGIPLILDPQTRGRIFKRTYDFEKPVQQNIREGRLPPQDILRRARISSLTFGVFCTLLVFAIGYFAHNAWVGSFAALLLLRNELFLRYATSAMADIHYNFFLLALCLALFLVKKILDPKSAVLIGSLCGVLAALACSVKITGIIVGGILFAIVLLVSAHRKKLERKSLLLSSACFCIAALIVIYGLNPYFWISPNQIAPNKLVQESRSMTDDLRAGRFKFEGSREHYPAAYGLVKFPVMFLRWSRWMESQKQFPTSSFGDNRFLALNKRTLFEFQSYQLDWIFLALGILFSLPYVKKLWPRGAPQEKEGFEIPLTYFFVNYLFILLFMKLNWGRYYLPTVIAARFLIALGIYGLIAISSFWYKTYSSSSTSTVSRPDS
jgi:4-amino-4-deoxy-L-arabinose transferase-like glycosyltransferase